MEDHLSPGARPRATSQYMQMLRNSMSRELQEARDVQFTRTFRGDGEMGCEHYAGRCKLKAACCGVYFCCRFCHDEVNEHPIVRFDVRTILCQMCMTEQPVSRQCVRCAEVFARYFCSKCRFFDDAGGKNIYHCDRCGICRIGRGPNVDTKHCDKCDCCVMAEAADLHRCRPDSMRSDCPVCFEYLFTSIHPSVYLSCSHVIHTHCLEMLISSRASEMYPARCPLCQATVFNTSSYNAQVEALLATHRRADSANRRMCQVRCNDCHRNSTTHYHAFFLRCELCSSFNTSVLGSSG